MRDINQGRIIHNLNQYLAWHHLPLRVDEAGICQGLASVYAKYAVQGQQNQFFELLDKIASMPSNKALDDEMNHFVVEIVLSQLPFKLNEQISQRESIETLQIEGKSLDCSFAFGLISSDSSWCNIIRTLQLKNNEVMLVGGPNHAIAVSKTDKHYIIYDPNYRSGFKTCSTEEQLIKELHHVLFLPNRLGLAIQIIRDPKDATHRVFPSRQALYQQYLVHTELCEFKEGTNNNLALAIRLNDKEAMDELFKKGFIDTDPISSAISAVRMKSFKLLPALIQNITVEQYQDFMSLFMCALKAGSVDSFHELLKSDILNSYFEQEICAKDCAKNAIYFAAGGGNVALLKYILDTYRQRGRPEPLSEELIAKAIMEGEFHALEYAITTGSSECINLLLGQLKKGSYQLTEEQWGQYLRAAVRANQPLSVNIIIDAISTSLSKTQRENIFESIHMDMRDVAHCDLSILRQLKANHVVFSRTAEGLMLQKENRPVGLVLCLEIMLRKLGYYVNEKILSIQRSIATTLDFKKKASVLRAPVCEDMLPAKNQPPT